jgi:hypothetical protein
MTPDATIKRYATRSIHGTQIKLHPRKTVLIVATSRSNGCHAEATPMFLTSAMYVASDWKPMQAASNRNGICTSGATSKHSSKNAPAAAYVKLERP